MQQAIDAKSSDPYYLCIPYSCRDNGKELKCRWDGTKKLWFCDKNNPNFDTIKELYDAIQIKIPYEEKEQQGLIKDLGGKYDGNTKCWTIPKFQKERINSEWII